jgi:hypothetical protein
MKWKIGSGVLFSIVVIATLVFQNCGSSGGSGGGSGVSGSGTLVVSPMGGTVALDSTLTFSVSGGTYPYSYVVTSGTGYFVSNVYYAPDVEETDSVTIYDAQGYTVTTTITVEPSGSLTCLGEYNIVAGGNQGTLGINDEDGSGNILNGFMDVSGVDGQITSGSCTQNNGENQITFTRTWGGSYQVYTGVMYGASGDWEMTGSYTTCSTNGVCSGTLGNWEAAQ